MHWLEYFLNAPSFLAKEPYLVLILRADTGSRQPDIDAVSAAVLLFQYRILGIPTRAFSTDDISGFRTVIAPPGQRAEAAAAAASAMLDHGAQFALITYTGTSEAASVPDLPKSYPVRWARRTRRVQKALPLAETFDATLATLGKSTRFNLRYYRKRLMNKMSCEFVADASRVLPESEWVALNAGSLNPVDPKLFRHQYCSARDLPGGFIVGLRTSKGTWLSLIGGWREGNVTVLYWQTNASGYEKDSIGTVMRSFFIENEIERGAREVIIYGGTTHSMGNSFLREQVTDLMVSRCAWKAALLRKVCRIYCATEPLTGTPNFLARAFASDDVDWHPVAPEWEQATAMEDIHVERAAGAAAASRRR